MDLADTEYRTTTDLAVAVSALFEQLGPLIVDLNLAGYEVTDVVAASGPTAPTVRLEVATMVTTSQGPVRGTTDRRGRLRRRRSRMGGREGRHRAARWNRDWRSGGVPASAAASDRSPPGPLPAGWVRRPAPAGWSDSGGWIACALPSGTAVPGGLGAALGTVVGNGLLGQLSGQVRGERR